MLGKNFGFFWEGTKYLGRRCRSPMSFLELTPRHSETFRDLQNVHVCDAVHFVLRKDIEETGDRDASIHLFLRPARDDKEVP